MFSYRLTISALRRCSPGFLPGDGVAQLQAYSTPISAKESIMKPNRQICLVLWLVVVLPGIGFGGQQELSGVIAAWQQRQARTQTAFYRLKVKHWLPRGTYGKNPDVPEKDTIFEDKYEHWLDFVHQYNRRERWVHTYHFHFLNFYRCHSVSAYDGKKIQLYEPLADIPLKFRKEPFVEFSIMNENYNDYEDLDLPIFLAHGVIPSDRGRPRFKQLRLPVPQDLLELRGTMRKEDREYLVVRARRTYQRGGNTYEYWVDREREGAIVHYKAYTHDQQLYSQLDISWQKQDWGFVPERWRFIWYYRGHIRETWEAFVDEVRVNLEIPFEKFHLSPPPGTIVTLDEEPRRAFRIAADGETLVPFREQENIRSSWPFYLIALLLTLGTILLLLLAKYRHHLWRQT
jgi:hypothetical protein